MESKSNNKICRKYLPFLVLPLFIFIFLAGLHAKDIRCEWTGVKRIFAVGDLHGDYEHFVKILRINSIVDNNNHWIAGKTHLVQIGDVLDRGDRAKEIYDLIKDLEKEAEKAGGMVHMLIGNHEEMNIGDRAFDNPGYISVSQLRDFLPDKFRERRENRIRRSTGRNPSTETDSNSPLDPEIKSYWENQLSRAVNMERHPVRREYVKNFNETYGKWILEHNAVIKIDDIVFVHGGISERYSTWPLQKINNVLRKELDIWRIAAMDMQYPTIEPQIAYHQDGPLWYRGFARPPEEEEAFKPTVVKILKNLDAKCMVTAHTPQRIKIPKKMRKYDGLIWIIDTTISRAYPRGILSALIIEDFGNTFIPWGIEREQENNSNDEKSPLQKPVSSKYLTERIQRLIYINRLLIKIPYPFLLRG